MKNKFMHYVVVFVLIVLVWTSKSFAENYYPLQDGLIWEYQVTLKSASQDSKTYTSIKKSLKPMKLNGKQVVPFQYGNRVFSYVIEDNTGIWIYATQKPEDVEPKISKDLYPNYEIKYPLVVGTTWKYTAQTNLLPKEYEIDTLVTIESSNDSVTVPAGTFDNCIRVRYFGQRQVDDYIQGKSMIVVEIYDWFAPGIGRVKNIRKNIVNNLADKVETTIQVSQQLIKLIKL
jgi:hypothetical protein